MSNYHGSRAATVLAAQAGGEQIKAENSSKSHSATSSRAVSGV